jgi:hypothetical protein
MIKNGMSIREKFIGLTMKPTSKSISTLLKLELTKMNLSSVKIHRKRKNTLFFHLGVSSPRVNPQHVNIPFHKSFILINF